jgi:hypothetical protein
MEEKLLKLMAQLGLIAVVIWALAGAFGQRDQVAIAQKPAPPYPGWAKGDVWAKGCIAVPYAQGTYQPGLQMGVTADAA